MPLNRGAECGYRGYRRYRAATYPSGQQASKQNQNFWVFVCSLSELYSPSNKSFLPWLGWAFTCVYLIECVNGCLMSYRGNGTNKSQRAAEGLGTGQQFFSAPLINLFKLCVKTIYFMFIFKLYIQIDGAASYCLICLISNRFISFIFFFSDFNRHY